MKKFLLLVFVTILSTSAFAQTEEGDQSIAANLGLGFDKLENVTLGIDYRFNISQEVRLAPSFTYFIKKDGLSAYSAEMNLNYVFPLTEQFSFYPIGGLSFTSYNFDQNPFDTSVNRLGLNLGLGAEMYTYDNIIIGFEAKYRIVNDFSQPVIALRVGYSF